MGLKPVDGIYRVTFKMAQSVFAVSNPEVMKAPGSETFVVFGEAENDDFMQKLQQAQANGGAFGDMPSMEAPEEEEEGEVDATGLEEDDISSVMDQASVSRNKAIKALKENDSVVDAIMALSA
jgi:nascent polypeptide-associated complex subunit alpha